MTTTYTNSKGEKVEIASMAYQHLVSAHKKAVASEERKHTHAHLIGEEYDNPEREAEREAEIDALAAEIARRDAAYAEQQEANE